MIIESCRFTIIFISLNDDQIYMDLWFEQIITSPEKYDYA